MDDEKRTRIASIEVDAHPKAIENRIYLRDADGKTIGGAVGTKYPSKHDSRDPHLSKALFYANRRIEELERELHNTRAEGVSKQSLRDLVARVIFDPAVRLSQGAFTPFESSDWWLVDTVISGGKEYILQAGVILIDVVDIIGGDKVGIVSGAQLDQGAVDG
ncbi:MAG: hypothetical protein RI637_10970, partial [Acidimicrobiia bacterium]|nr:hypothetical protein [Acidimicrobiia bacterium]